jgi:hypothetical protein
MQNFKEYYGHWNGPRNINLNIITDSTYAIHLVQRVGGYKRSEISRMNNRASITRLRKVLEERLEQNSITTIEWMSFVCLTIVATLKCTQANLVEIKMNS